ncbi:MAG TPA: hypothetical protein VNX40_15060, partial [Mucilaginibacter sp.]|nr:hypothetical protein [Mucilaginibacter sp.]
MKKTLLLSFLTIVISISAFSQPKQIQRPDGKTITTNTIDSIANKLMDTAQLTGLEIGIVNLNNISYVKSYGFKNRAKNQLNDT